MSRVWTLILAFSLALGLRVAYDRILHRGGAETALRQPLSTIPRDLLGGAWEVEDVPLAENVVRTAGVASYLNRCHSRSGKKIWLYVGYVDGWYQESIHYPEICFPASGLELARKSLREIPVTPFEEPPRFQESTWKTLTGGPVYTLSTFLYDGKCQPHEWRLRRDGLVIPFVTRGVPWFAIVTLSGDFLGDLEETRRHYARMVQDLLPHILVCMPFPGARKPFAGGSLEE
jgi:hypothetical protein